MHEQNKHGSSESAKPRRGHDLEERLLRARRYIETECHKAPSVKEVADVVGLSPFYFHRKFSEHFGITPKKLATDCQIERAKKLMRRGVPIGKVAILTGFNHQSHLTLRFRMREGMPPAKWLKAERLKRTSAA